MKERSESLRYVGSTFAAMLIFAVANYLHWRRLETCDDCFFPYGLPFAFFRKGGYAGGGGIVWVGVIGDAIALILLSVAIGWSWKKIRS